MRYVVVGIAVLAVLYLGRSHLPGFGGKWTGQQLAQAMEARSDTAPNFAAFNKFTFTCQPWKDGWDYLCTATEVIDPTYVREFAVIANGHSIGPTAGPFMPGERIPSVSEWKAE
jgi:hypothetical protein